MQRDDAPAILASTRSDRWKLRELANNEFASRQPELLALRRMYKMLARSRWFRATVLPTGEWFSLNTKL